MKSMLCPVDRNPLDQLTYICPDCGRAYKPKRAKVRKPKDAPVCAPCSQGRHADQIHPHCPDRRCHCPCRMKLGPPDVVSAVKVLLLAHRNPADHSAMKLAVAVALVALGIPKKKVTRS